MTDFAEYATRDLRLVLLRCLASQPGFRCNESVLHHEVRAYGFERSRDVIRTELRYLAEVGGIKIMEAGSVMVGTLTRRGHEHVKGLTVIEGINQPSPEA